MLLTYCDHFLDISHTYTKGQLISECLFDVLNFPKNQRKIWQISALEYKKWSNHKIKAHYNDFDTNYVQIILNIIRRCLYFVDLTTFYILGQKFVKFFVGFLENLRLSKRHSEINWPLGWNPDYILQNFLLYLGLYTLSALGWALIGQGHHTRGPLIKFQHPIG